MNNVPIIVISSSAKETGKTTLALNLAAALWSDGYRVQLFAPDNYKVAEFIEQRKNLCKQSGVRLPLPQSLINLDEVAENDAKTVIIADIPTVDNKKYADVFAKAHTLISVGTKMRDFQWQMTDPYLGLIWEAKKNIAARGVKYLNWIAVLNQLQNSEEIPLAELHGAAKRFGFRAAEPLHARNAFRYVENGYCAADMAKFPQLFKMSMQDVYARREILTLTDFLWKK